MKPQGRSIKPLTEQEKKAITEFLSNDESYQEMADKLGMPRETFRYKVNKYRKEQKNGQKDN